MRAIVVYYIGLLVHASDARCLFKSEDHGATYDLGPLNREQEIKIGSGIGQLFEALQGGKVGPQQSIALSLCQDTGSSVCHGEKAPGILVQRFEQPENGVDTLLSSILGIHGVSAAPGKPVAKPQCAVIGRKAPKGPQFALLDPADPEKGLQLRFEKGDECRPGQQPESKVPLIKQPELKMQPA